MSPGVANREAVRRAGGTTGVSASPRLVPGLSSTGAGSSSVELSMAGPSESGSVPTGNPKTGGRRSAGGAKRRRCEAQGIGTAAPRDVAGAVTGAQTAEPRRSARVAARTIVQRVRSRIVTGFDRREDDVSGRVGGDADAAGQGGSASAAGTPRRLREKSSLGAGSPAGASVVATPRRLRRKTSVGNGSPEEGRGEVGGGCMRMMVLPASPFHFLTLLSQVQRRLRDTT